MSEQINFPSGFFILRRDIGRGQSTILLAIELALFGVVRGGVDGASLLGYGKSSGYVELCFDLGGHRVIIHRSLRRNKSFISQPAGYIVVDDVKSDCTPVELKARVLDLLGYPKSLLTKSKALIYRYTVYTPQEEMKRILFEDAPARLETLRRIFQIEGYKLIRDNASVVLHSLKERLAEFSAKTEDLDGKKKQFDELGNRLKTSLSSVALLTPLTKENQSKIAAHQALVRKYDSDMASFNSLKSELAGCEASLYEKNQSVKAIEEGLQNALKQIPEKDGPDFGANLAVLDRHVKLLQSEVAGKSAVKSGIERLQDSLTLISHEITKAETNMASSKRLDKNVLSSETCPVCLQPIAELHKNHFRSKVATELGYSERVMAEKSLEKEKVGRQLLLAKQKMDELLENERRLAELSALYQQFSKSARESIISEIRVLSKKISDYKLKLQSYSSLEADSNLVKSRLEKLQQQEKELLIKKTAFEKELENLNFNMSILKKEIAEKEASKKLLETSLQLRNWLDEHFLNLMEVIERNVMLKVYNEFNNLFQNWFNMLMEEESVSARLDDAFTPVVEINGYEIPLENLSGGEKTSCALAYRLALNKVINDVINAIKTNDLLILDEPTDGFSSQQLEKVRDVLEQLQLPQIIIVSHESKIESFVQNVIRIVKEQHVSHAIT